MLLKSKILSLVLLLTSFNVLSKAKFTDMSQSKLAIEVDIKDLSAQVRMGITLFGDYTSEEKELNYKMPDYLTGHLNHIFTKLGVNYSFVEKLKPSEDELTDLKQRDKNKLIRKYHDDFVQNMKDQGYTDFLSFNFFRHALSKDYSRMAPPNISGYGIYKIPGSDCIYHTLGYHHINLEAPKKIKAYDIKKTVPEKKKADHTCAYGVDAKKIGIEWKKDIEGYTEKERQLIEKTIKNLVLASLLDTFLEHGFIKNQLQVNQMFIEFMQPNFIIIERIANNEFQINNHTFNTNELIAHLKTLAAQHQSTNILVGYQTKSKFTFGDLQKIFIPAIKNSKINLYRLGPEYEIINILEPKNKYTEKLY